MGEDNRRGIGLFRKSQDIVPASGQQAGKAAASRLRAEFGKDAAAARPSPQGHAAQAAREDAMNESLQVTDAEEIPTSTVLSPKVVLRGADINSDEDVTVYGQFTEGSCGSVA